MSVENNNVIRRITEEEMQEVYNWVDEIPLSRPKKNIARDFADGGRYFSDPQYSWLKCLNTFSPISSNSITTQALIPSNRRLTTGILLIRRSLRR
jgi:hypothetical protein